MNVALVIALMVISLAITGTIFYLVLYDKKKSIGKLIKDFFITGVLLFMVGTSFVLVLALRSLIKLIEFVAIVIVTVICLVIILRP